MQDVFNWFYLFLSNEVNWLFSMQVVPNVSLGMFIILTILSALTVRYIVMKAGL